ncbi:hypothetical protein [Paraburkholderia sp. BL27I4N3]|uniref:hypothetical protein n=1 Tax=Paraburkholderia sp. BL27I4N3 TaxID=1938805 RepID=UPI000E25421D|nr:hypothetical protein [Paraburkholderia sp. BL27I4N3]
MTENGNESSESTQRAHAWRFGIGRKPRGASISDSVVLGKKSGDPASKSTGAARDFPYFAKCMPFSVNAIRRVAASVISDPGKTSRQESDGRLCDAV